MEPRRVVHQPQAPVRGGNTVSSSSNFSVPELFSENSVCWSTITIGVLKSLVQLVPSLSALAKIPLETERAKLELWVKSVRYAILKSEMLQLECEKYLRAIQEFDMMEQSELTPE